MNLDNDPNCEPTLFSATIRPHRSLGRTGFVLVMLLVGGLSFVGGIVFFLIGAWPVVGFLGLDVLLVYWAFRANYRAAAAYEQVTITPSELRVRQVSARGKAHEWMLNPLWTRIDRETHAEFGLMRLFLVSRGAAETPALALRIRWTILVVEYPATSGMETTRPPAASTSSRPATWSKAQSAPLTRTLGSTREINSRGVGSLKIVT